MCHNSNQNSTMQLFSVPSSFFVFCCLRRNVGANYGQKIPKDKKTFAAASEEPEAKTES